MKEKEVIENKISEKVKQIQDSCDHKDEKGNYTIEYCSTYEARSSEMYCTQCKKQGSRKELKGEL